MQGQAEMVATGAQQSVANSMGRWEQGQTRMLSPRLVTFGDQGSPFAHVGWLQHPRISAGGPVLGGCCGILGDAGRPLLSASTLAPAQPPARAELRRSDGSRRLSAVTSRSRPGPAGAPSAPPCSAPASSTRPRWRARAAAWATRIARGARRASRPVPHGPSAVLASWGQVGAMGLSGEGLRGSWFGGFWEKLAGSAVPPAWGWAGPELPRWEVLLPPALPVLTGGRIRPSDPRCCSWGRTSSCNGGCADTSGSSLRHRDGDHPLN